MKVASLVLLLSCLLGIATPATAEIMEVTTSVTIPASATDDEVKDAVRAAARDILDNADMPQPVMVVVTSAFLSAGRLYVRFLIADEAGARSLGIHEGDFGSDRPQEVRL